VKDSEFNVHISSITSTGMIYWVVFTDNEVSIDIRFCSFRRYPVL